MEFTMEQYRESAAFLRGRLGEFTPKIAMVLGSGLGYLGIRWSRPSRWTTGIFPTLRPPAPGHKGRLDALSQSRGSRWP